MRLFKELYDSIDAPDVSELDIKGFIEQCEHKYGMSTEQFLERFEQNGYEGSVEHQMWALYGRDYVK